MKRHEGIAVAALCGASLALFAPAAGAQSPCATGKVAFVQGAAILNSQPEYVRADSSMQALNASYQLEIQKMGATLDSAANAYQEKSALMTPTTKAAELKKLQDQRAAMDQHAQELQQKALQQRQQLLGPIDARIQDVIDGMRAELNCSIIFDASSQAGVILSADKSLDLTQRVIDRLKAADASAAPATPPAGGIKPPAPHKP